MEAETLLLGRDQDARLGSTTVTPRAGCVLQHRDAVRDETSVVWKAHTLLPGRHRDARFVPMIVVRRAGGVLQRRGAGEGTDEPSSA